MDDGQLIGLGLETSPGVRRKKTVLAGFSLAEPAPTAAERLLMRLNSPGDFKVEMEGNGRKKKNGEGWCHALFSGVKKRKISERNREIPGNGERVVPERGIERKSGDSFYKIIIF